MLRRNVGRWISLLVIVWTSACAVISCGGGGGPGTFVPLSDASTGVDGGNQLPDGSLLGGEGGTNCHPKTCAQLGYGCGKNSDGCGNVIDCGSCTAPEYCGGGGYSKCGGQNINPDGSVVNHCTPYTCANVPHPGPTGTLTCGSAGDGCGGTLNCGSCTSPQYCGGGGYNQCGGNNGQLPDGGNPCTPITTCPNGQDCGQAADGCGHLITCGTGTCPYPQYCGGGGPSKCGGNTGLNPDGSVPCTPLTTCPNGQNCGQASNGCGGLITCGSGSCTAPQFCGGGGPNMCGVGDAGGVNPDGSIACIAWTCSHYPANTCGPQTDGCGGTLTCFSCTAPQTCGGGGTAGVCGCTPLTTCPAGQLSLIHI